MNAYRHGDAVGILLKTHTPRSGSRTLEAYRHQLPRFGISTMAHFHVMDLLYADGEFIAHASPSSSSGQQQQQQQQYPPPEKEQTMQREHLRFSLSFDGGFHHIPWMDIYNPSNNGESGKALSNLVITIVYSSSDGTIHGVHHREATYRDDVGYSSDSSGSSSSSSGDNDNGMPKTFNVEYVWVNEADVDVRGGLLVMFGTVLIASLYIMVGAFQASNLDEGDGEGGSTGQVAKRYIGKGGSLPYNIDDGSSRDVCFEKNL